MNLAANKFKLLKQTGKWEAPDENEEKLIALQTEIKKLKQKARNLREKSEGERKCKGDKTRTSQNSKPDWLKNNIKPNQLKETKEWKKNTYHWCCPETGGKCDGKWRVHLPAKCKGFMKGRVFNDATKKAESDKTKRTLKIANALQTIATQDSIDEDSE